MPGTGINAIFAGWVIGPGWIAPKMKVNENRTNKTIIRRKEVKFTILPISVRAILNNESWCGSISLTIYFVKSCLM